MLRHVLPCVWAPAWGKEMKATNVCCIAKGVARKNTLACLNTLLMHTCPKKNTWWCWKKTIQISNPQNSLLKDQALSWCPRCQREPGPAGETTNTATIAHSQICISRETNSLFSLTRQCLSGHPFHQRRGYGPLWMEPQSLRRAAPNY